jgi:tetratricopeptide (TPR) repeat protein
VWLISEYLKTNKAEFAARIAVHYAVHFENRTWTIKVPSILIRSILSVLLLSLLLIPFHRALEILTANLLLLNDPTPESYSSAIRRDPSNGEFWWLRGRIRQFNIDSIDIPGAIKDYEKALQLNPRLGLAWLDLADCYERIGEKDKAEKALQNSLRVWAYSPTAHWQAGNFYLMRGNLKKMYECFKMACAYDYSKLDIAIRMAWKVDPDHAAIYGKLIPDKLPANLAYLDFLASQDELDLARPVWKASLANPIPVNFDFRMSLVFFYLDRLLARNRVEDALRVWEEALQKSGTNLSDGRFETAGVNLVWNGSFEDQILRGGWDWRYPDNPEFEIQTDLEDPMDGLRSLKLTFTGTNIHFAHFNQIIPTLIPGAYQLEFYVKTDNLTTDQRPYIEIRGFSDPQSSIARTDMFPVSPLWKKYSIPFTVKTGVKAVQLLLRRDSSQKFDNQISGSLWLDKFSVRKQDAASLR